MAAAAIPELTYTTALYSLDAKKGTLESTIPPGKHDIFPPELNHTKLAAAIAVQHAACFKTGDDTPGEVARLKKTFSGNTIFIAICVGQTRAQYGQHFQNSMDQASATVQHWDHIGEATGNGLPAQYWIHEVCRFKNKEMLQQIAPTLTKDQVNEFFKQERPVQLIMNLLESEICNQGNNKHAAAFLMVETKPEHGSTDFLLKYYSKQGYHQIMNDVWGSHHFMGKSCQHLKLRPRVRPRGGYRKRKKKTRKRKKRKKTRRRRKKHYRRRRQSTRRRR